MEQIIIQTEEVNIAMSILGKNKAIGVDYLHDSHLRQDTLKSETIEKLRRTFQQWLSGKAIPKYLKTAKVILLSKEKTQYPSYGAIRPVSILPCTYKLFETIVNTRLRQELLDLARPLHDSQRGFRPGASTMSIIAEICEFINNTRQKLQRQRTSKTPVNLRTPYYAIFIDLKCAFDSVDR